MCSSHTKAGACSALLESSITAITQRPSNIIPGCGSLTQTHAAPTEPTKAARNAGGFLDASVSKEPHLWRVAACEVEPESLGGEPVSQ